AGATKDKGASQPADAETPAKPDKTVKPAKPEDAAKPGNAEASIAAVLSFSSKGYRVFYDESGDLTSDSTKTRDELLKAVPQATDVFILSHGWWNNPSTADCSYQQLGDGLRSRIPSGLGASFKPLI